MYRTKNYVMAGVRYGIGQSTYDPWAERNASGAIQTIAMHESPPVMVSDAGPDRQQLIYAAVGAGIGFVISKNPIGALIGAGAGYFLPNLASVLESNEPMPESPAREDSF